MNNNTLDIIRYICFREIRNHRLKIIRLPVALKIDIQLNAYIYDVASQPYCDELQKQRTAAVCNIKTIFGDDYKGKWWVSYGRAEGIVSYHLVVQSESPMRYKNTYYNSIESDKRFREMDV